MMERVMPGHRVEAIANEFLKRAKEEGLALTNMQLQKLPYIAHGWGLAVTGKELVNEVPRAFPYGPVYRSLYDALKRYGSGSVSEFIHENDGTAKEMFGAPPGDVVTTDLEPDEIGLLNAVWNAYKGYHAFQLSQMTHQDDSPWTIATKNTGAFSPITNEIIKAHFVDLANRRRSAAAST